MSNELTKTESKLYRFMLLTGEKADVLIADIWTHMREDKAMDARMVQQYLGAIISRTNRKLIEHSIVPGALKKTYRLKPKSK